MTLREAKQTIRQWIRTHFNDQRLAEVYAWNADGQMAYDYPCGCLLGVTGTVGALHSDACGFSHYVQTKLFLVGGAYAELAYASLGEVKGALHGDHDNLRRLRLSAILRAELRRRDRERALARQSEQLEVVCS